MIFSHFFRSKHLDPKPQVRIKAIALLDKELNAQKTILHDLAFHDPDANVSLAALHRLDSFAQWYKMSTSGKDDRVVKKSQQVVEKQLFDDNDPSLSEKEKHNFVSQCKDLRLLEKLVLLPWVQHDLVLAQSVLTTLAKPQIDEKIILESTNLELQMTLLCALKDEPASHKIINRLLKKTDSAALKDQATSLLQQWQQQQQLPVTVEKETRMLLSRLLALKDSNELDHIQTQQQQLTNQYTALESQFLCLPFAKQQEFTGKWAELNRKLSNTIDKLTPQWQAQQQLVAVQQAIDKTLQDNEQVVARVEAQLNKPLAELNSQELAVEETLLAEAYAVIQQQLPSLSDEYRKGRQALIVLAERIANCQQTLKNLPAFTQCLESCQALITQLADLSLPSDVSQLDAAEQYLREIKAQWRTTTQGFIQNLPADIRQQWQQLISAWQGALKQLNGQISNDLNRCRNKLRAVDALITQGRFRLAMDLYARVAGWYGNLPEKQQAMLEKNYQQIKQQIENLKDWQEYIATPRKPALLAEVEALVASPLKAEEQATAVKNLRQQWNSLGVIDSESDRALNQAFDDTIEQAFAPCRAHYDQQQKVREQNLLNKQGILAQLADLHAGSENGNAVAKQMRSLQDQWRKVGEVEFKQRNEVNELYQNAIAPLKQKVNESYQANAQQKEALLIKAQKCLEMDSLDDAVEQLKKLQAQWKTIDHAGRKTEAELWPKFRQVSDEVFAKRQEQQVQLNQNLSAQIDKVKQLLKQMKHAVDSAQDKAALDTAAAFRTPVMEAYSELADKERGGFARQLSGLEDALKGRELGLESAQHKQQYQLIFTALEQWQGLDSLPEAATRLPNAWQQAFQSQKPTSKYNRHELSIILEIVSNQDSPASDAKQRQGLQMQLMAQKLQEGHVESADELLKQWISCGPLAPAEIGLLARVQGLFA
jgi:exonuclease SbcC